jgi:hypothetical protein
MFVVMAMSDDNSYILPKQASSVNEETKDSEDETLESLQCHACIGCDGENLEPVVDATVVSHAAAGVAVAVPRVNAGVNDEGANALCKIIKNKILWLDGALVEVMVV